MISIRRIPGLLALAGTFGLGAETRAQARTVTEVQKLQFVQFLLNQETQVFRIENTRIRLQDGVLSRLGRLEAQQTPEKLQQTISRRRRIAVLASNARQLQSRINRSTKQERTATARSDRILASVANSPALQRLARPLNILQSLSALTRAKMDKLAARPQYGGSPSRPRPRLDRKGRLKTGQHRGDADGGGEQDRQ